jgi:hypothetical protein
MVMAQIKDMKTNGIEDPEIKSHNYCFLIFDKRKAFTGGKSDLSTKRYWEN